MPLKSAVKIFSGVFLCCLLIIFFNKNMSNSLKSGKKVISQNELRRIMNEQKKKLPQVVKKIESPLAKYSDSGELRCVLCDSPVRAESLWSAHLVSKEHLANIAAAKRSRERMLAPPVKRSLPPPIVPPAKKPRSILKNSGVTSGVPSDFFDNNTSGIKTEVKKEASGTTLKFESKPSALLIGNYSSDEEDAKPSAALSSSKQQSEAEEMEVDSDKSGPSNSETLPEGFFDDPKLDAKVRNVEYKDPIEEEWEKFQRAIKEEAAQSHQIIQEEQEEATAERQLEEIDEQMRNWSKVIELERRKDQVAMETQADSEGIKQEKGDEDEDSEDEEGFDEFLDWRSKQS